MTSMLPPAVDPRAAREAAQWITRLHGAQPDAIDHTAWQTWRAADPAQIGALVAALVCLGITGSAAIMLLAMMMVGPARRWFVAGRQHSAG